jgi:hypothetical protein
VYTYAPHRLIGLIQPRVYGYPAPMRMHTLPGSRVRKLIEPHGARLVASIAKEAYGGHWRMTAHFVVSGKDQGKHQEGGSAVGFGPPPGGTSRPQIRTNIR